MPDDPRRREIPFAREVFGTLGDVRLKRGRQISHADLADIDLLVVRSITHVDAALLAGTRVKFTKPDRDLFVEPRHL